MHTSACYQLLHRLLFLTLTLLHAAISLYSIPHNAQAASTENFTWRNDARLTASDAVPGNLYSSSLAIDGETVVVGANGYGIEHAYSGTAYIFEKSIDGWNSTTERAKLIPSDSFPLDGFGYSVSINDDIVAISKVCVNGNGLPTDNKIYIFSKPDNGWLDMNESAILYFRDYSGCYNSGISVSIYGDTVIAGAPDNAVGGTYRGAAYVFEKPQTGWTNMAQKAKLTTSDGADSDKFGYSVSIDTNTIVAGAPGFKNQTGSAYVFTKPTEGWSNATETSKLSPSDGSPGDNFGYSVAISNDTIVIGTYENELYGNSPGAAYVFVKPKEGWTNMTEMAKLTASDGYPGDQFGSSVSIDNNTIIIGAFDDDIGAYASKGSVYVFNKPDTGWRSMTETKKITTNPITPDYYFGISTSISGDSFVAGAFGTFESEYSDSHGAAYLFTKKSTAKHIMPPSIIKYILNRDIK